MFRSAFKRSLSDGNILHENCSPVLSTNRKLEKHSNAVLSKQSRGSEVLSESSPEISTSGSDIALSRFDTTTSIIVNFVGSFLVVHATVLTSKLDASSFSSYQQVRCVFIEPEPEK